MITYPIQEDIELVRHLLELDSRKLSADLGISRMTLSRWAKEPQQASRSKLETFYSYAFKQGIRLNKIHAQLFIEESRERDLTPLFHGSKTGIKGPLSTKASRTDNDFGSGFYCGEHLEQAGSFIARFPDSACYFVAFDERKLIGKHFLVDSEWMLAISLYRGKLSEYSGHPILQAIMQKVRSADFIVAPIADNRMFDIIDSFIDGEITDMQCKHCLSATDLGSQYVLKSDKALQAVMKLQPHFLCFEERNSYLTVQKENAKVGADKVKAAKRKYRAQGQYIEELLS